MWYILLCFIQDFVLKCPSYIRYHFLLQQSAIEKKSTRRISITEMKEVPVHRPSVPPSIANTSSHEYFISSLYFVIINGSVYFILMKVSFLFSSGLSSGSICVILMLVSIVVICLHRSLSVHASSHVSLYNGYLQKNSTYKPVLIKNSTYKPVLIKK